MKSNMKQTKTAPPPPTPQRGPARPPTRQVAPEPEPEDESPKSGYDWGASEATGLEHVGTQDLGIPFLTVLQSGSPEVKKSHPDHATRKIEGAGEGDIINTVTRKIMHKVGGDPAMFIPCSYERVYNEWKPRSESGGGGFVRRHPASILNECTRNEKNQDFLRNGNLIVTTAVFYGLVHDPDQDAWEQAIIAMTSTQLKQARVWLNIATSLKVNSPTRGKITPPLFSHVYALTSAPDSNELGSWCGWHVELSHMVDDRELIDQCAGYAKRISTGIAPAALTQSSSPAEPSEM